MVPLTQPDICPRKLYPLYTDENSRFFKWSGVNVHYKDGGKGTPIVFLHGTSSSLHTWDKLTKLLTPEYRIVRLDLIGFGVTGPHPKRDYSIEMYLNLLHDFIDFLELDKFFIAGNSWGGMLAWNYTAIYPRYVSGLILLNSAGFELKKTPNRFKFSRFQIGRWILKRATPKWMVKRGLKEVLYSHRIDENLVARYRDLILREGNRQAFIDFMMMRRPAKTQLLSSIRSPTLLLWGRHDKLYPLRHTHLFKERIANTQLEIVEDSAHLPMEEAPATCARKIKKFINALQTI